MLRALIACVVVCAVLTSYAVSGAIVAAPLCVALYGKAGNVNYPWSAAISLTVTYDDQLQGQSALGTYYNLTSVSGTRVYTGSYGDQNVTAITSIASNSFTNQRLYLASPWFDAGGLGFNLAYPIQFPGGADNYKSFDNLYTTSSAVLVESPSFIIDGARRLVWADIPDFTAVTTDGASSDPCEAAFITLDQPTDTSFTQFSFSYFISAPGYYNVIFNSTITTGAITRDSLGNYIAPIVSVTGTRVYTWLRTSPPTVWSSIVTGPSSNNTLYTANNLLYPFSTPFIDYDGFNVDLDSFVPRTGTNNPSVNTVNVFSYGSTGQIEEGRSTRFPTFSQQQLYFSIIA